MSVLDRLSPLPRWQLVHYRARRALYRAELDHYRDYTPASLARVLRASEHLRTVELNRPWTPRP